MSIHENSYNLPPSRARGIENFNKTKIIATAGPASASKEVLANLIKAGASIFRLNFSHGTYAEHKKVIDAIRALQQESSTSICLLQDLQGPKIRIGKLQEEVIQLHKGQSFILTQEPIMGTKNKVATTYPALIEEVQIGNRLLIDDGKIVLQAIQKKEGMLITEVVHGGYLRSNKGINLPSTQLSIPSLTEKDQEDLAFGLEQDVEWIALSFVRSAQDIIALQAMIKKAGKATKVVAKIEKPEALGQLSSIIEVADALMVARGDLGVEIAMERVPIVQKEIVQACNKVGKPVIIATQMMESMIENPLPTRAETNDIANAVIDGADALMLSGETALGKYPIQVVTEMKKTILAVEQTDYIYNKYQPLSPHATTFYNESVVKAACILSQQIQAKAIICLTQTGWTALELAKHRPQASIFVFTDNRALLNNMCLIWNVRGYYYDCLISTDQTFSDIEAFLVQKEYLQTGDVFISLASMPIQSKQRTNMLKVNQVQ
jgi:pyruvate kinase